MIPLISLIFGTPPAGCAHQFFGLEPWFQYLPLNPYSATDPVASCSLNIQNNGLLNTANWNDLWLIAVALFDDLLRIAGFLAVLLIIWGGIRFMTSQGEPQGIKQARETVLNSVIGLAIVLIATNLVNFLGNQLGNTANSNGIPEVTANKTLLTDILGLIFAAVGAIALVMIIIGGIKYITSRGEPQGVASAKNTILYALIGVAVAIFGWSIVVYIITNLA